MDKSLFPIKKAIEKQKSNLRGADLSDANYVLRYAKLINADLRDADLTGAQLWHTELYGADLRKANLSGARLDNVDLREADLTGANMKGTKIIECFVSKTKFNVEDLIDAILIGPKGLKSEFAQELDWRRLESGKLKFPKQELH